MRLFNYNVEFRSNAKRSISYFNAMKSDRPCYRLAIMWFKFTFSVDQYHLVEVEVHKDCNGEVQGLAPDGISYCTDCETIVEGETEYITTEEYEARHA